MCKIVTNSGELSWIVQEIMRIYWNLNRLPSQFDARLTQFNSRVGNGLKGPLISRLTGLNETVLRLRRGVDG